MAFPAGVQLRTVRAGLAFGFNDGAGVTMIATFTANRALVWGPTGDIAVPKPWVIQSTDGQVAILPMPVTDQAGWRTQGGAAVSVANGLQSHKYDVKVVFRDENWQKIGDPLEFETALPTGDLSDIDLELLLPLPAQDGTTISIPDTWSAQIAAAQAAAAASATSAAQAATNAGKLTIAGTVTS